MSVRKAMVGKPVASTGQRNRSESPAPNQADSAGVASAGRRASVSVALRIGQWDALDNVAPNHMGTQLAALLIHRHAPRTPRAAAELIERLWIQGQPHGPLSDSSILLQINLWVMLHEHVAAMLRAGYEPHEASLPRLIRAIVAEHTPGNPEEALVMWCAERAAIPTRDPAQAQTALGDEPTVVVTVHVPGALARCVDLARFELSAAQTPALDTHLLSALIWAHADPANHDALDALMGHLVTYEGAVALAGADASLRFRVPESLRDRLHAIAAAVYWRALRPGTLAATLLWTHTETRFGDPAMFEHMLHICEDYTAAARVIPGDASLP